MKAIKKNLNWKTAVLISLAFAFIFKMFLNVFPAFFIEFNTVYFNYILTIVVALTMINLFHEYKKYIEAVFILVLMLWFFIVSRMNNYIPTPKIFLIMLFTFVAFCYPLLFTPEKSITAVKWLVTILLAVFSFLAVFGVISYFTRYDFYFGIPATDVSPAFIGLYYEPGDPARAYRLSVLSHPNNTGTYYSIMIFLSIYSFLAFKSKYHKVFAVLCGLLSYSCVVMSLSRTALLSSTAGMMVCAVAIAWQKISFKKLSIKIIASFAIGLLSGALLFASFSIAEKGFNLVQAPEKLSAEGAAISVKPAAQAVSLSAKAGKVSTQSISFKATQLSENTQQSASSFSGREHIWRGGLQIIKNDPSILLKGYIPLMSVITEYANSFTGLDFSFVHMHSTYLFLLIALGIPGILIVLAFLIKMAINCFKLIFVAKHTSTAGIFVLPSIIVILLISDTMSCDLVEVTTLVIMPIFFLICGIISYYAKQCKLSDFKQNNL